MPVSNVYPASHVTSHVVFVTADNPLPSAAHGVFLLLSGPTPAAKMMPVHRISVHVIGVAAACPSVAVLGHVNSASAPEYPDLHESLHVGFVVGLRSDEQAAALTPVGAVYVWHVFSVHVISEVAGVDEAAFVGQDTMPGPLGELE